MSGSFFETVGSAIRLELVSARGSTPREAGTVMYVSSDRSEGTIGGGRLEYIAIEAARDMLIAGSVERRLELPLGPEIGQCCGGHVAISMLLLDAGALALEETRHAEARKQLPAVYIFGAGHVGRALAAACALLPVHTVLVDEREAELEGCSAPVRRCLTPLPEAEVRSAPPGSAFVVLTHDHALDFIIAAEALMRGDAAYVGMIGSKTKRASFERWCAKSSAPVGDTTPLVCPIGAAGSGDKRPEVIAAYVAAEVIARLTAAREPGDAAVQKITSGGGLHE
ncbi:xanthine dehydrogenase accessory protein XdhC [Nisaea acidiphila]|uniref:Xanthine dehydrogenase accessory protein XdhC n=1 Tax=Nisaea acidiphila TaxID=1862145 RepID=A0A9J7APX5_9PROT|nr:xanthine dehydrogenase accessory protein XdhC [Nisaea acidiphila]UUX49214.1 xanthine dehydrogenase accessory protein XdhC [Nisaea acidiphila]